MSRKLYKREEWYQARDNELFIQGKNGFVLDNKYTDYPNYGEYSVQANWYEIDEENGEEILIADQELISTLEGLRKEISKKKADD